MSKQSTVRLPAELTGLVDAARGDVPRERWVRRVLESALSDSTQAPSTHRKIVHAGTPTNHEAQRAHVDLMAERQRNLEKARKR